MDSKKVDIVSELKSLASSHSTSNFPEVLAGKIDHAPGEFKFLRFYLSLIYFKADKMELGLLELSKALQTSSFPFLIKKNFQNALLKKDDLFFLAEILFSIPYDSQLTKNLFVDFPLILSSFGDAIYGFAETLDVDFRYQLYLLAHKCFSRVKDSINRDPRILFNWGNVLYNLSEYEEDSGIVQNFLKFACEKYYDALSVNPNDTNVLNNLGTSLLDLGQYQPQKLAKKTYERAFFLLKKSLGIDFSQCDTHFNLIKAYLKLRKTHKFIHQNINWDAENTFNFLKQSEDFKNNDPILLDLLNAYLKVRSSSQKTEFITETQN